MIALAAAAVLALAPAPDSALASPAAPAAPAPPADASGLSPDDLEAARIAWRYFERNTVPATGLTSSVEGFPATSLWDLGSSLVATVAARELGLLDAAAFDARATALLRTVGGLRLFRGELPNKSYDARTGEMTDYQGRPTERGIGWSALDLGRFAAALQLLARLHPERRPEIARAIGGWRLCALAAGGELRGAVIGRDGKVAVVQEGRLGYEQYAARALARLGLALDAARRYDRFAAEERILGVRVRRDRRDQRTFGAPDALATDPWALATMELGVDDGSAPLVRSLFDAQKQRWAATGVVTALGEDHVDREPWFVYGGVWASGAAWRTVTPDGADASRLAALSTKAAFALATLYPGDPYARVLRAAIAGARDPERGWYAGVYERGGAVNRALTANTNGVVLEALLFRARGVLLAPAGAAPALGDSLAGAACAPEPLEAATAPAAGGGGPAPGVPATGAAGDALAAAALGVGSPGPAVGRGQVPAASPSARQWLRLDGTVFAGYRGADRGTAGALATLWPWGFTFVRAGAETTPFSPYGTSRLLWGIGYDDWHDRTFFLHVDNWGPVRPHEGLATQKAELNAGYKLPRLCVLRSVCAAPVASVVAPFSSAPYLDARVNLGFGGGWFVMGGVGWTVPGVREDAPRWRFVYGFGRSDWKPGSVFLTYYDWGPDSRSGNGILAVGVNWGF